MKFLNIVAAAAVAAMAARASAKLICLKCAPLKMKSQADLIILFFSFSASRHAAPHRHTPTHLNFHYLVRSGGIALWPSSLPCGHHHSTAGIC